MAGASDPDVTTATATTDEFIRLKVTNALSTMRVVETLGDLEPPRYRLARTAPPTTCALVSRSSGEARHRHEERQG